MPVTPTQVVFALALALTVGIAWYVDGRGRWRAAAADRLLYGVPWGTLLTVALVVAFYLAVQGGARHWDDPVTFAFVSWSYLYPTGLATAGFAHGGPDHLLSNMVATLVFGAIAEHAWGHYPRSERTVGTRSVAERTEHLADGGRRGPLSRPWIRALVVVPGIMLAVALLTAVFSLGPGLGFSGAVFAIVGFALVLRPLSAVVGVVVTSTVSFLAEAFARPVVRETVEVGPPLPPGWAGIGFHAHLLGFLLGALLAAALLSRRRRHPSFGALVFGVLVVGSVQSLWLLAWSVGENEYALYQGVGAVMVLVLALVVAVAGAGSERAIPRPFGRFGRVPSRRTLAHGWLALVGLAFVGGVAGVLVTGEAVVVSVVALALLAAVLAVPGLPPLLPDRILPTPVSRRTAGVVCLAVLTLVLALVSVPLGLVAVGGDAMPGTNAVTAGDYAVTYEENATAGQEWIVDVGEEATGSGNASGVIVVSDDRELWTVAVTEEILAFEGRETVTVGGIGWRESVTVERTGWEVLGTGTAYAVDITPESEEGTTRAFTSDPVRASADLDGHAVEVVPTREGFDLVVETDGEPAGSAPIPAAGEVVTVGDLSFSTVEEGETTRVVVETDGVSVPIAERERYRSPTATPPTGTVIRTPS
ncbi:rhomboid family intramembrane serine protease [Natronorarus salvus]|uniref:rhomboid family intramembrane serine protease n=1 Tax=Natronorarus salvus TaxID=3117733 RepID=UPI002F268D55